MRLTKRRRNPAKKIAGRIGAALLSLVMLIGVLPLTTSAESGSVIGGSRSGSGSGNKGFDLVNAGVPQNYSDDMANPYGYAKGQKFLLAEQSELWLYYTYKADETKNNDNKITKWFDNFQAYIKDSNTDLSKDNKATFDNEGKYTGTQAYGYVAAVGFDPNGTGRKDHVAYVGYENGSQAIDGSTGYKGYVLWVQNTATGEQKGPWKVSIGSSGWLESNNADLYAGSNFFNIVAGDFNGDGKDDLVISVVDDGGTYGLSQYRYENGNLREIMKGSKELLHPEYTAPSAGTKEDIAKNKISMDFAVGDFNGDGIDDFAVLSYMNRGHKLNGTNASMWAGIPYLSVSYGASGSGSIAGTQRESTYVYYDNNVSMYCATIAAGDIDNDGKDEILAAGYSGKSELLNNKLTFGSDNNSNLLYASFAVSDGSLSAIEYTKLSMNAWTKKDNGRTDNVGPKLMIEAVAANGKANPESIFISGDMYTCTSQSNKLDSSSRKTLKYFQNEDTKTPGGTVGKSYIASVAVGDFAGNYGSMEGCEQVAYVVGLQRSTGKHQYSFSVHMAGLNVVGDDYYNVTGTYIYYDQEFGLKKRPNCVVVAIDRDNDGIMASYKGSGYAWSDPQVRAILQASPYFSELNDNVNGLEYLYDSPETTYATSLSYSYSTSSSDSVSFGVGFAGSIEGGSVSADMKLGFASEWTKTFTKSLEIEITDSFEAGAYDSVVLCRTPVFLYNYDVSYPDDGGHPVSGVMEISVPKAPVYTQLTIDEYNEFAAYYNDLLLQSADGADVTDALLQPVADYLYLGQEGNPFGYYRDDASGVLKNLKTYGLLKNLTTSAGSNSSEYSYTESEESSVEISHGFSFELCIMGGFGVGGASAKAGGYTSLQYMKGHSVSKSNGTGTTIGGKVMGLDGVAMRDDGLDPSAWSFNWKLATWDSNIKTGSGDDAKAVPVIGYVLSGIKAPAMPVENLKMQFTRSSENAELYFDLSWDCGDIADSGRSPTAGYFVYLYDNATDTYRLIDTIDDPQTTAYHYRNFYDGREYYQFKVLSYCEATMTAPSLQSAPRYATYYMSSSGSAILKIEKTATDGPVDTYTIHFIDGTTQTFTVTNGNGIVSIAPISFDPTTGTNTYQITFTDGSSTTFTVTNGEKGEKGDKGEDGKDGKDGQDGKDGVGIDRIEKLRTEGNTDYYVVYLTNGTSYIFTVTNGVDGKDGENGKDGKDGLDGKDGENGKDGKDGLDGKDGENGKDGKDGLDGKDGEDGKDGKDGLDGKDGENGKDGKDGENGKDGKDGLDGKDGENGKDGKDGIGIVGIRIDENGNFIFTLSDGSELNAGSTPTNKEQEKQLSKAQEKIEALQEEAKKQTATRTVAICGLSLAGTSLLWQASKLLLSLVRAKRN